MKAVKYIISYETRDVFDEVICEARVVSAEEFNEQLQRAESYRWGNTQYMTTAVEEAVSALFQVSSSNCSLHARPVYSLNQA